MRKAILLGGIARIIPEPSRAERQAAMLHSLLGGRMLSMEASQQEVRQRMQRTSTAAKAPDPFDAVIACERGWIMDQLQRDIEALGAGPEILAVDHDYRGWNVQTIQWQANGIAARTTHTLKLERTNYREAHDEAKLRKAVSARFAKPLARQAEQVRELGRPRLSTPDEIDLSRFQIDMPLAAMLKATYPDAAQLLRAGLAANNDFAFRSDSYNVNADQEGKVTSVHLSYGRDAVRGEFTIVTSGVTLKWSKGALSVFGMDLPETVWTGCTGRTVGDLFEHPMFPGTMRITAVHPTRRDGRDGWALTLKDTLGPMPSEWCRPS